MDEFFARNRLSAYLDGELETGEAREVEAALAESEELREELEELRAATRLMRAGGPVRAPKGFARRLDAKLAQEPLRVGWMRHLHRVRVEVVMLAAAAAVVIVWAGRKPEASGETGEAVATVGTPASADPLGDAAPGDAATGDAASGALDAAGEAAPAVDLAGMPGAEPDPAVAGAPGKADGVLGGDTYAKKSAPRMAAKEPVKSAAPTKSATKMPKAPANNADKGLEVEPYAPAWEQQGALDVKPTVTSSSQIRLTLTSDTGLKDLDAFARSLGGSLTDERGRQLPTHLIEIGETRKVKLSLPAATALSPGELYSRLQAFGAAELVSSGTFYPSGTKAPVVIEVTRE